MTDKEFSRFYERSRANFERIAYSYVYDSEAARDIVTDCFLYLWEHRREVYEENLSGYVYMAVRNRCISFLRGVQRREKVQEDLAGLTKALVETTIANLPVSNPTDLGELTSIYHKALDKMPELTRNVFLASRDEELTYSEIAAKYSISVRKVTSEIQLALKILRQFINDT